VRRRRRWRRRRRRRRWRMEVAEEKKGEEEEAKGEEEGRRRSRKRRRSRSRRRRRRGRRRRRKRRQRERRRVRRRRISMMKSCGVLSMRKFIHADNYIYVSVGQFCIQTRFCALFSFNFNFIFFVSSDFFRFNAIVLIIHYCLLCFTIVMKEVVLFDYIKVTKAVTPSIPLCLYNYTIKM